MSSEKESSQQGDNDKEKTKDKGNLKEDDEDESSEDSGDSSSDSGSDDDFDADVELVVGKREKDGVVEYETKYVAFLIFLEMFLSSVLFFVCFKLHLIS